MRYIETTDVGIDDLEEYPGNARVHADRTLNESAITNGQYRSIVARRLPEGRLQILAGHGTREAFRATGASAVRVEVIQADDEEARRIVLVDNRANDLGSYDENALLALLEGAADLTGTGYDDAYLEALLAGVASPLPPDEFPGYDDAIATEHRCPKCGYEWSGSSSGGA